MTKVKIAVSLPEEQVIAASSAVDRQYGAPSDADYAWAEQQLDRVGLGTG